MAITWSAPLAAPAGLAGAVAAGGSVSVGTWYITVTASNSNTYSDNSIGILRSAPCTEVTAVTSSGNQTINISWTAVAGAVAYNVYMTQTAPGTATRWANSRLGSSDTSMTTSSTSFSATVNPTTGRVNHDTFTSATDELWNFDKTLGSGNLVLSGTVGTITHLDIYNAMVAAGATAYVSYGRGHLAIKGAWNIAAAATGSMSLTGVHLANVKGPIINNSSSFTLSLTNCVVDCIGWSVRVSLGNATCTRCIFRAGTSAGVASEQFLWGGDNYFNLDSGFVDGGNNTFINTIVQCSVSSNITDLSNTNQIYLLTAPGAGQTFLRCKGNQFFPFFTGSWDTGAFVREYTSLSSSSEIRMLNAISTPIRFSDCTWGATDPTFVWSSSTGWGNVANIYQSLKITVVDYLGNAIQNATVTCKDATGSTAFTQTTDSSGTFTAQDILRASFTSASGVTVKTEKNPFTITISKAGYKTYTTTATITAKTNWTIVLQQPQAINMSKLAKQSG